MLATAAILAIILFAVAMLADLVRDDGRKILAALKGQSWAAQRPPAARPITIRFSQRYPEMRALRARPEWRAAA